MERETFMTLLSSLKEGSVKNCYNLITKENLSPIKGPYALKLLVTTLDCLNDLKTPNDFKHLQLILNSLKFEKSDDNCTVAFIQSVFHLMKFLLEKEKVKIITDISQNIILPNSILESLNQQQGEYYKSCKNLLYKYIKNNKRKKTEPLVELLMEMELRSNFANCLEFLHRLLFELGKELPKYSSILSKTNATIQQVLKNGKVNLTGKNCLHLFEIIKTINSNLNENEPKNCLQTLSGSLIEYFSTSNESSSNIFKYLQALLPLMEEPISNYGNIKDLKAKLINAHEILAKILSTSQTPENNLYLEQVISLFVFQLDRQQTVQSKKTKTLSVFEITLCLKHLKSQALIMKLRKLPAGCCCKNQKDVVTSVKLYLNCFQILATNVEAFAEDTSKFAELLESPWNAFFESFEILFENNCKYFTTFWPIFANKIYYLIGQIDSISLYKPTAWLCQKLLQKCFIYGGEKNYLINDSKTMSLLLLYKQSLIKLKQSEELLKLCMIAANYFPAFRDKFASIWNITKYESKLEWTMVEFFRGTKCTDEFLRNLLGKKYRVSNNADVLIFEFENYLKKWTDAKSIEKTLEEIQKFVSAKQFFNLLAKIPLETFLKMRGNILQLLKTRQEIPLLEAIRQYFLFKEKHSEAVQKLKTATESQNAIAAKPLHPRDEALKDVNDNSDLLLNYSMLQFAAYDQNIMQHLLKSAEIFQQNKDFLISAKLVNFLDLLVVVANELTLHCYEKQAQKTMKLAFDIAEALKDSCRILEILTLLSRFLTVGKNVQELYEFGAKQTRNLEEANPNKARILCSFYSCFARVQLKCSLIKEFKRTYEKAIENYFLVSRSSSEETLLDMARDTSIGYFYLLICKMDLLPCQFITDEIHGDDSLYYRESAWRSLYKYFRWTRCANYAEFLTLLFDISDDILSTNFWYRLPREIRSYGGEMIKIAETGFLPIRVSNILVSLAKADVLCCKELQLSIKINYLDEMFKVQSFQSLEDNMGGLCLESTSGGSPKYNEICRKPQFLKHTDCDCLECRNRDLQELHLERLHLQACLEDLRQNYKAAEKFHLLLHNCYNILLKKFAFNRKDKYLEASLDYIYNLITRGMFEDAVTNIDRLIEFLGDVEYKNYHIFNEFNIIKLTVQLRKKQDDERENAAAAAAAAAVEINDINDDVVVIEKTPENVKGSRLLKSPVFGRNPLTGEKEKVFDIHNDVDSRTTRLTARKNLLKEMSSNGVEKANKSTKKLASSKRKALR